MRRFSPMRYLSFDFSKYAFSSASVTDTWFLNASARHQDHVEFHLLIAAAVFGRDVGVVHRHPAGERVAEFFDQQRAAQRALELRRRHRRVLHLQQRAIALLADEPAVLLEAGQRQDALANFDVADADALLARFGHHGFFVDQLLQDLAIDAELLQQRVVQLAAVGVAIRGHLRVVAARELADGDRLALDVREHLARGRAGAGGEKIRDVEDHEGQDDERQAPFQPALVTPHPVEHCHCVNSSEKQQS